MLTRPRKARRSNPLYRQSIALAESARTGQRWFDAETHRVRGEILLKRNPADPSPAEEASLTAIAIRATPFQLRAAMSVASLYHSTGRPAEAHDNSAAGADRIFRAD